MCTYKSVRTSFSSVVLALFLIPTVFACSGPSAAETLTKFCDAAADGVTAPSITATDNAKAIKTKISSLAANLVSMSEGAPSAVKDDIALVADSAKKISEALAGSESLTAVATELKSLNSAIVNDASTRINKFVSTNCQVGSK